MKWFKWKAAPPIPPIVEQVNVNQEESTMDLAHAMNASREARVQAVQAHEVVARLTASRIRNGFAPVIEESIIRRHLGGTA